MYGLCARAWPILVCLLALPTVSSGVTLTFDDLNVPDRILDFYNGGFTAGGQGPGPDFGISFSPSAVAVYHPLLVPPGNHSLEVPADVPVYLNVPSGLGPIFSFYYSSDTPVYLRAWDAPNATGNAIASTILRPSAPPHFPGGIPNVDGTRSFSIESSSTMWADNLTFGEGYVVPEPSTSPAITVVMALLLVRSRMRIP